MTSALLCDIEGTIGSISFVRDTLFPYALEHLESFVTEHADAPEVAQQLQDTARLAGLSGQDTPGQLQQLMDWSRNDVKATPLKALQGLIWRDGYESGAYQAHVYADAVDYLKQWHSSGIPLYVYSSGSKGAQKLFLQYSAQGDLRALFSGFFDTTIGAKKEADSYHAIAREISVPNGEILFLSDVEEELNAAAEAGLQTTWVLRPEDWPDKSPGPNPAHPVVSHFGEISLNPSP